MAARSKALFCGRSPAEIVGSNPTGAWMFAWCECYVLSGRGLCDELITRPEESYRLWKNHHILTGPPVFWRCHTMAHVPLIFLSEWREFPSALCLAGKKNLMTARVFMLLKSRASPDMLLFSLCKKKRLAIRHFNRPLFPTTLSIPSYDMEKYVGLRIYQHALVARSINSSKNR